MGPKKYRNCPKVCGEDVCKVLGCGFHIEAGHWGYGWEDGQGCCRLTKHPIYLVFYYIL